MYGAALDGAEKAAAGAGNLDAVAAITKEHGALVNGGLSPAFPAGLPKSLQTARKAYLDSVIRASSDVAPRQKAVNADYIRALVALQAKAAGNAELANQIAAEKQKVLSGVVPASTAKTTPTGSAKNVALNGTFDVADADGAPGSWTTPRTEGVTFKLVKEGGKSMLRVTTTSEPKRSFLTQEIPVPAGARTFTLGGKVRGKWTANKTDDDNWGANINAQFVGADGRGFGPHTVNVGGKDAGWKALSKTGAVQDGATVLKVYVGMQAVAGTFDFDDIEVEFR
jgi:hypothetical protein